MFKKLLSCAALLLALAGIVGAAEPSKNETLRFAVSKNVGPLNPHLYSPNEMFAQDMVYEGLVKFGENGEILP